MTDNPTPIDGPVKDSPFHPEFGLPDTYRLRALRYAEIHGVEAAVQAFNLGGRWTIYRWRARYARWTHGETGA